MWKASLKQQMKIRLSYWPWIALTMIRYWLTGNCGNACGFILPYGWVPEADCPIHDR